LTAAKASASAARGLHEWYGKLLLPVHWLPPAAAGSLLSSLAGKCLSYSAETVAPAFLSSSVIGMIFAFMPARSESWMNPVDALAREYEAHRARARRPS